MVSCKKPRQNERFKNDWPKKLLASKKRTKTTPAEKGRMCRGKSPNFTSGFTLKDLALKKEHKKKARQRLPKKGISLNNKGKKKMQSRGGGGCLSKMARKSDFD